MKIVVVEGAHQVFVQNDDNPPGAQPTIKVQVGENGHTPRYANLTLAQAEALAYALMAVRAAALAS